MTVNMRDVNGSLVNKYSLSIGEVFTLSDNTVPRDRTRLVELYQEHNAYHVRVFYRINGFIERKEWLVFDKYSEARDAFKRLGKEYL